MPEPLTPDLFRKAKEFGFSDAQLAHIWKTTPDNVRALRKKWGIESVFKTVDTCAAEFEAYTPYYYSRTTPKTSPKAPPKES